MLYLSKMLASGDGYRHCDAFTHASANHIPSNCVKSRRTSGLASIFCFVFSAVDSVAPASSVASFLFLPASLASKYARC
jgi:hypothetical protein